MTKLKSEYLFERFGKMSSKGMWLGASDRVREGFWQWADGRIMFFTNWYPNQPNNYPRDSNCLEMRGSDGYWDDKECSERKTSLCEYQVCAYPIVNTNSTASNGTDSERNPLHGFLDADLPEIEFNSTALETNSTVNATAHAESAKDTDETYFQIIQTPFSPPVNTDPIIADFELTNDDTNKPIIADFELNSNDTNKPIIDDFELNNNDTNKPIIADFELNNNDTNKLIIADFELTDDDTNKPIIADFELTDDDKNKPIIADFELTDDDTNKPITAEFEIDLNEYVSSNEVVPSKPVVGTKRDKSDKSGKKPLGTSPVLSVLLGLLDHMQQQRRPCVTFPHTNGEWVCNSPRLPWLCMLNCDGGLIAGDGVVSKSGVHVGEGVIVCDDGQWSRTDYYCA